MTEVQENIAPTNDVPPSVIERHISNPIDSSDYAELRREAGEEIRNPQADAASAALKEKRQRDWESGVGGDDPFAEQDRTVIPREFDGRFKGPVSLREATRALSDAKHDERADVQRAAAAFNVSPAQIREYGKDPKWVAETYPHWTPAQVGHYVRTGEMPPFKIGTVDNFGNLHAPLEDLQPIPLDKSGNLREVTKASRNFRQQLFQEQQRLAEELGAQQGQEAEQAPPAPQAQPAPQPQPQAQRQIDPVQQVQAQLQAEHRAVAEYRRLSAAEVNLVGAINQLDSFAKSVPEYGNEAALRETYAKNPQRFALLAKAAQEYTAKRHALVAQLQQQSSQRMIREDALQKYYGQQHAAQLQAYKNHHDGEFQKRLAVEYPDYSTKAKLFELRGAVEDYLESRGYSKAEVQHAWNSGAIRDVRTQMFLCDAAIARLERAKAREAIRGLNSKKAPLPSVQRPGVARIRGSQEASDIRSLERELESAKGDRAVRLSAKLHQARRAAGYV
jgi:hypothetical protein